MSAPQPPVPPSSVPGGYVPAAPAATPTAPPVTPYRGPFAAPTDPSSPASADPSVPAPTAAPAAPYVAPVHPEYGAALVPPAARRSATLGIIALIAAGLAALTPVVAAIAAFQIGLGAGSGLAQRPLGSDFDLGILTPVRGWVLVGELSFWIGTALGIWAIVQGVIAIVRDRGRIAGVVAVVVAIVAPIVFGVATWLSVAAGLDAGGSIGG